MKPKTIYLCGAINGCTDGEANDWRQHVMSQLGGSYAYLDPMRRDYRGREAESVNEIVLGDYADINASDIVLANCEKPSWGTAMEIHHAFIVAQKRVIVVCGSDRISPWLRYHSHRIERCMGDAIGCLKLEVLR